MKIWVRLALFVKLIVCVVAIFLLLKDNIKIGELHLFADDSSKNTIPQSPPPSPIEKLLAPPVFDPKTVTSEEVKNYINLAIKTQAEVSQKIEQMKNEKSQLENVRGSVEKILKKIEDEKQFLLQNLQKEQEIKEDRLKTLVTLYEKMEPKKAAPIFETMDQDLAIALFKALKNKQTTAILSAMQPETSKKLTEYMGRVGSGREYELLKEMNQSLQEAFSVCDKDKKESKADSTNNTNTEPPAIAPSSPGTTAAPAPSAAAPSP